MQEIINEYRRRVKMLEHGEYSVKAIPGELNTILELVKQLPLFVPAWFSEAEINRYEDEEEMIADLPKLAAKCYNKGKNEGAILTPDIVTRRIVTNIADMHNARQCIIASVSGADFVDAEPLSVPVMLIYPCRFNSLQLKWITGKLSGSRTLMLELEGSGVPEEDIRQNDVAQLEFLIARWEIEKEPAVKDNQMREIVAHFNALLGGEVV